MKATIFKFTINLKLKTVAYLEVLVIYFQIWLRFSHIALPRRFIKNNIAYIIVLKNKLNWDKKWNKCIEFVTNNFRKVYESNNILILSTVS